MNLDSRRIDNMTASTVSGISRPNAARVRNEIPESPRSEGSRVEDRDGRRVEGIGGHSIRASGFSSHTARSAVATITPMATRDCRLKPAVLDGVAKEKDGSKDERDTRDSGEQLHADQVLPSIEKRGRVKARADPGATGGGDRGRTGALRVSRLRGSRGRDHWQRSDWRRCDAGRRGCCRLRRSRLSALSPSQSVGELADLPSLSCALSFERDQAGLDAQGKRHTQESRTQRRNVTSIAVRFS